MWNTIVYIFSVIATVPILPFLIVFFGYSMYEKKRKKVIRLAMDISTPFFIVNVGALFNKLFSSSFGLYGILLIMIIVIGLLGNSYYRKTNEIPWKKILRMVWRLTFFITAFLYIVLSVFVIFKLAFTV